MAKLANIAQRLSTVPQPTAAFRSSLRSQLMATAHQASAVSAAAVPAPAVPSQTVPTQPVPAQAVSAPRVSPAHGVGHVGPLGPPGHGLGSGLTTLGKSAPLWAKLFAGVAAISVSATGVAVGAERALPGDLFYGVKKQVEAVQLDLAGGAHQKALTEFGFAQARLNELHKLINREHVVAGQPVSKDTAAHLKDLLENWAVNTGVATTSLIQQIEALGSSTTTVTKSEQLRTQLSNFTSQQFTAVGKLLGSMPTASLQSLTVSALGYLQRVDGVLGHDPAALISQLPASLNSVPGVSAVLPRLVLPSSIPVSGGKVVLPGSNPVTGVVPGNPLPTNGSVISPPSIGSILPPLPGVIGQVPGLHTVAPLSPNPLISGQGGAVSNPLPGAVQSVPGALKSGIGSLASQAPGALRSVAAAAQSAGGTIQKGTGSAVNGAGKTVTGTLGSITGGVTSSAGPSLPLPTSLPALPTLPKLP